MRVAAGGTALVALGALAGCDPDPNIRAAASPKSVGRRWEFRSRPDLAAPPVEVVRSSPDVGEGYLFAASKNGPGEAYPAPDGPLIFDGEGQPVWFRPVPEEDQDAMDFKVQRYRGEPVLTWWQGVHGGWGDGMYVIFDRSYREIARLRAGNGLAGDHHEFLLTDRDTALISIYRPVRMDLSSVGGPQRATVMEGVVQELEVETNEVLFEWRSLDHVGFEESSSMPKPDQRDAYDYFHINSIAVDNDGDLLVGARKTSAAYKVDRESGEVVWRLGGKKSDFEMGEGARFAFQHDVRRHPDGTLTLFDNRGEDKGRRSRGVRLGIDEERMTAELLAEYTLPDEPFAIFQANVQDLPNGNVFVGWGSAPYFSEHRRDGGLLFEARFPEEVESYRAFRFPWEGRPSDSPTVTGVEGSEDRVTVYASWNGATEVERWEVLAGSGPDELWPLGSAPKKGFETEISFTTDEDYVAVGALDRSGRRMGISNVVRRRGAS